jgi:hypothetical protein
MDFPGGIGEEVLAFGKNTEVIPYLRKESYGMVRAEE